MNNHKNDRPEIRLPKPEIIRNSEVDPAVLNYESVLPNLLTLELNYLVSFRQIFQNKQDASKTVTAVTNTYPIPSNYLSIT